MKFKFNDGSNEENLGSCPLVELEIADCNPAGHYLDSRNLDGRNRDGRNRDCHNRDDRNRDGRFRDGRNRDSRNRDGRNTDGCNRYGRNRDGHNRDGRNCDEGGGLTHGDALLDGDLYGFSAVVRLKGKSASLWRVHARPQRCGDCP